MLFLVCCFAACMFPWSSFAISNTCYYPNGAVAKSTPCNQSGKQSHCCEPGDFCLDNGLCYDFTGTISQSGCTDPTWDSSECFQFCKQAASNLPMGATGFYFDLEKGVRSFCCDLNNYIATNNTCSYSGKNTVPFQFPFGKVITDRSTGSIEIFNSTHTANQSAIISTVTATATAAATVTVTANGTEADSKHSSTREAAIGAGVGAPLAVALLVVSWLFMRERKRAKAYQLESQNAAQAAAQLWPAQNYDPKYGYPAFGVSYQEYPPVELDGPRTGELETNERFVQLADALKRKSTRREGLPPLPVD